MAPKHLQASTLLEFYPVVKSRPLAHSAGLCLRTSRSTLWLPLALLLEDSLDGSQVNATSAVVIITGLVKSLQAINGHLLARNLSRTLDGCSTSCPEGIEIMTEITIEIVEEDVRGTGSETETVIA